MKKPTIKELESYTTPDLIKLIIKLFEENELLKAQFAQSKKSRVSRT